MNNIYIKDERFYLREVQYLKGAVTVEIKRELKKSLRYQKLFLIDGTKYQVVDLAGLLGNISVSPEYSEAYVIVRTKEPNKKEVKYDEDDLRIIKCFIHYFSGIKPEITEKLCKAVGYNILSDYHRSFGVSMLGEFKSGLFERNPMKIGRSDVLYYGRPRYNLLSLMKDFTKTPDLQIFTDPELIGKYKRISRRVDDGSVVLKDRWAKFTGVSGNRTRANISINTNSKVKVEIPENEVGVKPGNIELSSIRSFALVVDGKLNMEEIGIKTSDTKFIGKLKRLGIVEPMLMEGEYVINLTRLPLFPKRPPISSYQLGYAEFKVRESDIMMKYLELLIYRQEKKLEELPREIKEPEEEKTEVELFLEGLGIYGDSYYPAKTKTLDSEKSYLATEVIGKIEGIPSNLYPNLRNFINTGSCKNAAISQALKNLAVTCKKDTSLEELKKVKEEIGKERKSRIRILRGLKFQVISGKTLTLSGNKQLEREEVNVKGVKVSWDVKKTEIKI